MENSMKQRKKSIALGTIFFMSVLLFSQEWLCASDTHVSDLVFGDGSPMKIESASSSTAELPITPECCATIEWIEVPGQGQNYQTVCVLNKRAKRRGDIALAFGILSHSCQHAVQHYVQQMFATLSETEWPFQTFKREIVHADDAVKDFALTQAKNDTKKVTYALAFPFGSDFYGRPFVMLPHALNYIYHLAQDTEIYKEKYPNLLDRIRMHAADLCRQAVSAGQVTHRAPLMIVDTKKIRKLMIDQGKLK
jgi:hypothetical protein